jgi:hypothetical protein
LLHFVSYPQAYFKLGTTQTKREHALAFRQMKKRAEGRAFIGVSSINARLSSAAAA